jgi:hypothetical protein
MFGMFRRSRMYEYAVLPQETGDVIIFLTLFCVLVFTAAQIPLGRLLMK